MLINEVNQLLIRILIASLTMLGLGLVMVSSASMALSDYSYGSMYYHTATHFMKIILGIGAAIVAYIFGVRWLQKLSPSLMMIGFFFSLLIFVPGLSVDVNGAVRWLKIGPLVFQPYDLFKMGYILFLAHALERYQKAGEASELGISIAVLFIVSVLLILQPDFGSFSLLMSVMLLIFFLLKGINRELLFIVSSLLVAFVWLIISAPYRMKRIETFFNPWSDRYGSGFQLIQAMVAEGSGGISGVGLGQSVQKMLYLPEAHTDFPLSIFAEETGLIGVLFVLALITYLCLQLTRLSFKLRQHEILFECYLVFLIAAFIFIQSFFNIGVNYGLLPTNGITLPLMGYGGTSVVSHIAMIGMVMSIGRDLKYKRPIHSMEMAIHDTSVVPIKP